MLAIGASAVLLSSGILLLFDHLSQGQVLGLTFADDAERVRIVDINSHFRSVYGRNPTVAEWRFWAQRTADTPQLDNFLRAMRHYRGQGESPAVEDSDLDPAVAGIRLTISHAGAYLFEGDRLNFGVTLTNESLVQNSGTLEVLINTTNITDVSPTPADERTLTGGIRRIRHRYDLAAGESLPVVFQVTVPAPTAAALNQVVGADKPTLEVKAQVVDLSSGTTRRFRVVEALNEDQSTMTHAQRQVPIIFLQVYDRVPTTSERAYWRGRLRGLANNLGALRGAMEFHQRHGIPH